ncbi:MAG: DUF3846 domain-containing protein [Clostridiales bacterium]|nr:DUF3846 domain-containing protein [Clostridiales bacterium]
MTEENRTTMRVILCRAGEFAKVVEMEDSLKAMQEMVGGLIEEYMPWEDEVAIICNEEGKMNGLTLNRAIRDDNGSIQDVIAGDFFICYAPIESERFLSMPPELEEKYLKKFEKPERFYRDNGFIIQKKWEPAKKEPSRDYER